MNPSEDLRKNVRGEDDIRGSHAGIFNQLSQYFPKDFVVDRGEDTEGAVPRRKVQQRQRTVNHEFPGGEGQTRPPMHNFQRLLSANANRSVFSFGRGET